jgi:hypothetical protein
VPVALRQAGHQQSVDDITQAGRLRRTTAINAALGGNYDLVALLLAQHPDDSKPILQMIQSDSQISQQRRDALIMELTTIGILILIVLITG